MHKKNKRKVQKVAPDPVKKLQKASDPKVKRKASKNDNPGDAISRVHPTK